jgi:glycosyltransferase involved in cell wall biosynthesis
MIPRHGPQLTNDCTDGAVARSVQSPISLGFLCPHNSLDRRAFSGTAWHAANSLATTPGVNLTILGQHRRPGPFDRLRARFGRAEPEITLDTEGLDAVVGLVATPLLNQLARTSSVPFLHVTDATPAFLRDVYGWKVPQDADAAETLVARDAARVVYSSTLMAERAQQDLAWPGLNPVAVPFGVNLEELPSSVPCKPSLQKPNLLFVGLDWERKGGDIAVSVLDTLRAQGLDASLTVVGRTPDRHRDHEAITFAGFLDKNRPRDRERLVQLFREAHLLVLPTRGDCTPMVVAEAMAYATPVIATETGGIPEMIGGGAGRTLAMTATPDKWAQVAHEILTTPGLYSMLSDASFDRAKSFSWSVWAQKIAEISREAIEASGHWRRSA